MAYQPRKTPEQIAADRDERARKDIADALAVKDAAAELHMVLHLSAGEWTRGAQCRLFNLCRAMIDLVDDGDCAAQLDTLMFELSCDEDGNPVRQEAA